jgi:hypothetical protein
MSNHDDEAEVLKTVFPQEYALLGQDRIKQIVESSRTARKSISRAGETFPSNPFTRS